MDECAIIFIFRSRVYITRVKCNNSRGLYAFHNNEKLFTVNEVGIGLNLPVSCLKKGKYQF